MSEKVVDESIWFSLDKVLSYNALLNFVVGPRGCGKTYGTKKWALKKFLKSSRKFIYLRRFKDEQNSDDLGKFFNEIKKDETFKAHELTVKGRKFFCDGLECGEAIYLSVQQSKKSVDYSDFDTIIFDEFIIEKGYQHYLPDEPIKLINFIDTVFRHRVGCRCICLANSIKWVNPYFTFFKFSPMDEGYQVAQDGTVLLNVYKNEKYTEMKNQTKLAKMIKGTVYEDMSINNKFEDMNNEFIKARPKNGNLEFNIQWKNKTYGLWYDSSNYWYVISYVTNKDSPTICYSTNDYRPNMKIITDKRFRVNTELKRAFVNGFLFFEDMYIRNEMYDLFTLLGIR